MGWANASYLDSVLSMVPPGTLAGKAALSRLKQVEHLQPEAEEALRRYSRSEHAGQEDGKSLNAALLSGDSIHEQWAADMDGAFTWTFTADVLVWRGFRVFPSGSSPCFISTSLVERQARQYRSRGGAGLAAILLPSGFQVSVPACVWHDGDDTRTLGVVRREVEVILPRGTELTVEGIAIPFADRPGGENVRVQVYRASAPEPLAVPVFQA